MFVSYLKNQPKKACLIKSRALEFRPVSQKELANNLGHSFLPKDNANGLKFLVKLYHTRI